MKVENIFSIISKRTRIERALKKCFGKKRKIEVFGKITSTNTYLKKLDKKNNGHICVALTQTGGRGRGDKPFLSFGEGLYMSVLYMPKDKIKAEEAVKITCSAAVAVCESIRSLTSLDAKIKWVNDIYINDKKVCGILTEGNINDSGCFEYFVLGVGVNIRSSSVPSEINDTARALYSKNEKAPKNILSELCINIIKRFESLYGTERPELIRKYREYSMLFGREVTVIGGAVNREAEVLDVCDDFSLKVKYQNGDIERLASGEVSLRLLNRSDL